MAGTLFGLGLSPQFDANGDLARGALLYVYAANTSTPADTYSDFGLASAHAWPLAADAAGRLPAFWLPDGDYRAYLTTATGVTIFDEPNIAALGASSGGAAAAAGVSDFITGDPLWVPVNATRSGWVRANARTIGSAASSATERANADTSDLYAFLWDGFGDSLCPVAGGRGGSAAADFAANKAIGTLDMRGRGPFGLDTMGNSAASVLASGTTPGAGSGAETATLATTNIPAHTHGHGTLTGTTNTTGAHTHSGGGNDNDVNVRGTDPNAVAMDNNVQTTGSNGNHSHTVALDAGVTGSTGDTTAFNKMPPYRLGTWYLRL